MKSYNYGEDEVAFETYLSWSSDSKASDSGAQQGTAPA
jgi:hypothetical protein